MAVQWRVIADVLRARIEAEQYMPGSTLPTETELGKTFAVSRNTIRLAIMQLDAEGLVETHRRHGTRVRLRPRRLPLTDETFDVEGWENLCTAHDLAGNVRTLPPTETIAPHEVRKVLWPNGQPGTADLHAWHFYAGDRLALIKMEWSKSNTKADDEAAWDRPTVATRMPTGAEREQFDLLNGVPVLCIQQVRRDTANTPIDLLQLKAAGDLCVWIASDVGHGSNLSPVSGRYRDKLSRYLREPDGRVLLCEN